MFFFVLSGFVLALPYMEGREQSYGPYLIRRIWRIYLPYLATILVSALLLSGFSAAGLIRDIPGTSTWFIGMQHTRLTWSSFADLSLMLGQFSHAFVTSTWTWFTRCAFLLSSR